MLLSVADDVDAEKFRSQPLADSICHLETATSTFNQSLSQLDVLPTIDDNLSTSNDTSSDNPFVNKIIENILSSDFQSTGDMEAYVQSEVIDKYNALMDSQVRYFSRIRSRASKFEK